MFINICYQYCSAIENCFSCVHYKHTCHAVACLISQKLIYRLDVFDDCSCLRVCQLRMQMALTSNPKNFHGDLVIKTFLGILPLLLIQIEQLLVPGKMNALSTGKLPRRSLFR